MSALAILADWQDVDAYHTTHRDLDAWEIDRPAALERRPILDATSEPHAILSILLGDALTSILMTADGATAALKQRTTGSKPGTIAPVSSLAGTLDDLRASFARCRNNRQRLYVVKQAQETAVRLRYAPDRSKVKGTPEWRQAIGGDPRSCRVLAEVYGIDHSTVSRIKKEFR